MGGTWGGGERGLERWVRGASGYFMYSARRLRAAEEIGAFWASMRIRDGSELWDPLDGLTSNGLEGYAVRI